MNETYIGPIPATDAIAQGITAFRVWMQENRHPMPSEIPHDPIAAAKWWQKNQRPAHEYADAPRQVNTVGGGNRWEQPYVLRLLNNFRAYCMLPEDQRSIVTAAAEDGVYWNGDRIKGKDGKPLEFIRIYDETLRMREMGIDKYRRELLPKLKESLASMTGKS